MSRRDDSSNWNHLNPERVHPNDFDRSDVPEPQTSDINNQTKYSTVATAMATAFVPLKISFEIFLTRLSRDDERSEKSKNFFKKLRCYQDVSESCKDTWLEVMKLHFKE